MGIDRPSILYYNGIIKNEERREARNQALKINFREGGAANERMNLAHTRAERLLFCLRHFVFYSQS